jgi:hypothetical protein
MTMLRILTASSLIALAANSAMAQQADPATPTAGTESITTTQSPADPATSTPTDPSAQTTTAAPAAESRAVTVEKLVDAEFPTYDANSNGDLDQAEFSKWVLALQGASGDPKAAAMDETAKNNWAQAAFASADADKSKKVSKEEMNKFLAG